MWGGRLAEATILVVAFGGMLELLRRGPSAQRRGALVVLGLTFGTLVFAWAYSHWGSPAWAERYFAIVLAPFVIAVAIGFSRLPVLGAVTIAVVFLMAYHAKPSIQSLEHKSNVANLAHELGTQIRPGTVVFSTQPEEVSNIAYYFPKGLRYHTPLGAVKDTGVMDWRDAMKRLDAATYASAGAPFIRSMRPGQRVLLLNPRFSSPDSPWTVRIRHLAREWRIAMKRSPDLRLVKVIKTHHSWSRAAVSAYLFVRTHARASAHGGHA
jgi:hypothetical protein